MFKKLRKTKLWNILTVGLILSISVMSTIVVATPVYASTVIDITLSNSNQDARYYKSIGAWTYSINADPLYAAGKYDANNTAFGSGYVFTNVTIPVGATIDSAYISVKSHTDVGIAIVSKIYGQDSDNASIFSTEADFKNRFGVNGGTDLRTTANVSWNNIADWSAGTYYNSPDIKTIIQEIVDRVGWASGNNICITWNDWAEGSGANEYRWVYGYDGGAANAPKIHIEYTSVTLDCTTVAATNIEVNTAQLNGTLDNLGGEASADCYFEWDTDSGAPYANDTSADADTLAGTGAFNIVVPFMLPGDTIYFRAVVDNGVDVVYGAEDDFTLDNYIVDYIGDSITVGTGASVDANSWQELVEAATGYDENNEAVGATRLYQQYSQVTQNAFDNDSIAMMLLGYNDMRYFGTGAPALTTFGHAIYSVLALAALPSSSVYEADNGAITYAGTWGTATPYTGINTKYSGTAGSTATATLTGSTVYVDGIQYAGYSVGLKVTIDGVDKGTFYNSAATDVSPYLLRFTGLTNAAHTVVCTVVAGGGYTYINWMGASDGSPDGGTVYVAGSLKMQNYATYPPYSNGSDSAVTQYNSLIQTAVTDLVADGLDVVYVDVNSYFVVVTDFTGGDGVHPNDSGHDHIADAFLASMGGAGSVAGHTDAATAVTETTATLNGEVTDMGGEGSIDCYFQYGTTVAYGTDTSANLDTLVGAGAFSVGITTLLAGTTYHFRAVLDYGDFVYGADMEFTTTAVVVVGAPTNLTATQPTDASIKLDWTKGGGSDTTLIKYSLATYPTDTDEGTQFYSGALSTATLGGFEVGVRVYISAWGEKDGVYSTTYVTVLIGGGNLNLSVESAGIFSSYYVSGDWLIVADCINTYPDYVGVKDVTRFFQLQLLDTTGTTIIAATTLKNWYEAPTSIYLSSNMVTPLTWGSGYIIKMIAMFEPYSEATYTLQQGDWVSGNLTYLDKWVLSTANKMSNYYSLTGSNRLTTKITNVGEVLTSEGGAFFTEGIESLAEIRPNIFQLRPSTIKPPTVPAASNVFDNETSWDAQVGARISTDANAFGAIIGVSGRTLLSFVFWGVLLIIMIFIFWNAKGQAETPVAFILCIPIILMGNYLRVISIQITLILAALLALYFAYKTWMTKT